MFNHKNFKILEVSKDPSGCYLKLEIYLPDGTIVIRWGLDAATYHEIKKITSQNYFDLFASDYYYELLPYGMPYYQKTDDNPIFYAYVRCVQGGRAARIQFVCSKRFVGNLEWFRKNVNKLKDIEHLRWKNT